MTVPHETEAEGTAHSADSVEVVLHVPRPLDDVWVRLTQRDGIEDFLGEGAMLGDKGDPWRAADGTFGVTRSYHPAQQVRVSWHADDDAPATMVDLQMRSDGPEGKDTLLTLRHENLTAEMDHAALTERWEAALRRLAQV